MARIIVLYGDREQYAVEFRNVNIEGTLQSRYLDVSRYEVGNEISFESKLDSPWSDLHTHTSVEDFEQRTRIRAIEQLLDSYDLSTSQLDDEKVDDNPDHPVYN